MRSDDFELVREVRNTKQSKKKTCPVCGDKFKNLGSHMKAHD